MKLSISIHDALLPRLDERDTGKGRSEVLQRIVLRYLGLVRSGAHNARPHQRDIDTVAGAVRDQVGGDGAAALITDDPLGQLVLVDAAEIKVARERREVTK
jgi:hypothetical protein